MLIKELIQGVNFPIYLGRQVYVVRILYGVIGNYYMNFNQYILVDEFVEKIDLKLK